MHHHTTAENLRLIGMCVLIFIVSSGLGAAGYWSTVSTKDPVSRREALAVVRALGMSALAALALVWTVPRRLTVEVAAFFAVYSLVAIVLMAVLHRRTVKNRNEADPYE